MSAARRAVAVLITLVTAAGVAVLVAELFRGVVFGRSHADPGWLILGGAWAAAMLAATVAVWTGGDPRRRPALWGGAVAMAVGAAVLASGTEDAAHRVLVVALGVGLGVGLVAAGRPGSQRHRERS